MAPLPAQPRQAGVRAGPKHRAVHRRHRRRAGRRRGQPLQGTLFSPRDRASQWDIGDQPPEFWNQYKTEFAPGTHVRIHPLLDWTELNIWEYIGREQIPTVSLYYDQGDRPALSLARCGPAPRPVDRTPARWRKSSLSCGSGKFANIAERRAGRRTRRTTAGSRRCGATGTCKLEPCCPTFWSSAQPRPEPRPCCWYLAEHRAVFMSRVKETNFFAYGVDGQGKLVYASQHPSVPGEDNRRLRGALTDAGDARAVGEASPIYLECPQAPGRIRATLPDVRLVCCLRNPVERAYALPDVSLAAGPALRARARPHPGCRLARPDSRWMDVSRYHDQLARYYETFPSRADPRLPLRRPQAEHGGRGADSLPLPRGRSLGRARSRGPPTTSAGCRRAVRGVRPHQSRPQGRRRALDPKRPPTG